MQVSVETTGNLQRRVTVEIPEERIEQEVKSRLKDLARTVKLDGFRPGKTPLNLVERRFAGKVRTEVLEDLMRQSFKDALQQEQLRPASPSQVKTLYQELGKGLGYTATFEIYPQITLAPLHDLKIARPVAEILEQDIDDMLETLRRQRQTWVAVEREARLGDKLHIELKLSVNGAEFQSNEHMPDHLVLGANTHPKIFEEKLLGMTAGTEVIVDQRIAQDHADPSLAGNSMQYLIKVNAVSEPVLPAVDEDFIHGLGVAEGTSEALRREVRTNLQRELDNVVQTRLKTQVVDALLAANPIEVPKALVESESEALQKQAKDSIMAQGNIDVSVSSLPSAYEAQARRRVSLGLLMSEIVKQGSIKLDPAKVRARVEAIASTYEDSSEVIRWYYSSRESLSQIEAIVLEDQVVEWIVAHADVTPDFTSFGALMNRESPPSQTGT